MPRTLSLLLATAACAAITLGATPAAAAFLAAQVGPNSDSATQTCSPPQGGVSGSTTQHFATTCFRADVGTASGEATAATGHVGSAAHADSHNGDSLVAKIGSEAIFDDFLVFHSTNPLDTTTSISANLLLDGILEAGGPVAIASVEAFVNLNGAFFDARYNLSQDGLLDGFNQFIVDGGSVGGVTDLAMHTPFVTVFLDSPVHFQLRLQTGAAASGPGSHALADFGVNSFKLPSSGPAFQLADGVTANVFDGGGYLVNNHFIDPLAAPSAPGVPEPAAWALMIAGFGLAGAALRRRCALAA